MEFERLINAFFISDSTTLGLGEVILATIIPFILAVPISLTYRYTQKHANYSPLFVQSILLFASLTSLVTLIIGGNIARAFGLVGALSIVRFRNALKSPIDTVYIFWALVLGMACGSGYYLAATVAVIILLILTYILHFLKFGEKTGVESVIRVNIDKNNEKDLAAKVTGQFAAGNCRFNLMNVLFSDDDLYKTYIFHVKSKSQESAEQVFSKISAIEGVQKLHQSNTSSSLFGV